MAKVCDEIQVINFVLNKVEHKFTLLEVENIDIKLSCTRIIPIANGNKPRTNALKKMRIY